MIHSLGCQHTLQHHHMQKATQHKQKLLYSNSQLSSHLLLFPHPQQEQGIHNTADYSLPPHPEEFFPLLITPPLSFEKSQQEVSVGVSLFCRSICLLVCMLSDRWEVKGCETQTTSKQPWLLCQHTEAGCEQVKSYTSQRNLCLLTGCFHLVADMLWIFVLSPVNRF